MKNNKNQNIFLGLDLGATKICAVVCKLSKEDSFSLLGTGISLSAGIINGQISNKEEFKVAINKAIQRAEKEAGVTSKKICLTLPSLGLEFVHNRGMLVSKSETGQITSEDASECIKRSKNVAFSSEKKLLHAIALNYKVEDHYVENPTGVFGRSLEVESHLVLAKAEILNTVIDILKENDFFINGVMFDGIALSSTLLMPEEQKSGAIIVDFGGTSTKLSFIKQYNLQKTLIAPIGSDSLTKDIAACLQVSIPEAERLKILYGNIYLAQINPEETIEVNTVSNGPKKIKVLLLGQIIESRVKEIFLFFMKNVAELSEDNYPVVFVGGGALLKGFIPFCKEFINPNSKDGVRKDFKGILESSLYAAAVGTLFYSLNRNAIEYKQEKKFFQKQIQRLLAFAKR